MLQLVFLCLGSLIVLSSAECYEPSPAFPLPAWAKLAPVLQPTFEKIESKLQTLVNQRAYDSTSYSLEVTWNAETLWESHSTASRFNESRPGVKHVDGNSQYRIASITKTFTTLAILHQAKADNLSLDAPVLDYIEELRDSEYELPWKDITIRNMASQLSGLPREFAQSDLMNSVDDPTSIGLPPVGETNVVHCDEYNHYKPCNRTDLLEQLKEAQPLFAPNAKSTYSNLNFELLGLVIENVTGLSYENYINKAIFEPLNMTLSSLSRPSDEHAVLPLLPDGENYWDVKEGVQNPTGGIYSTSSDMAKYMRYILTHFNTLATGVNWFLPSSFGTGMNNFYGMPFEIFRTDKILEHSQRPISFTTKGGGLPGYYSLMTIIQDYGLGVVVLVGGKASLVQEIQEIVTVELVRAAERIVWRDIEKTHAGTYVSTDASLNSSIKLISSPSRGLYIDTFISNSTDVLAALFLKDDRKQSHHMQLVPTLLYEDEKKQQGEIWRAIEVNQRTDERKVWDDLCVTDVDVLSYAGKPVNKLIYWHEEGKIELPAWNVTMRRSGTGQGRLVVQAN